MAYKVRSPFYKSLVTKGRTIEIASINGMKQWAEISSVLLQSLSFTGTRLDLKTVSGQTEAFGRCAPVAAIVSRIAEFATNGRYTFVDQSGKEVTPQSNLVAILQRPNQLQTWQELISSAATFIKLHGQCYILPIVPAGFEQVQGSARSLFVVPNWMIEPQYTYRSALYHQAISGYRISGLTGIVPVDSIIVVRDTISNVQQLDRNKIFEGQSRLYSLGDQVNNLIAVQDALYSLTTKRGAMGAWVPENSKDGIGTMMPIDPKEKSEIDAAFAGYGVNSTQTAYMVLRMGMKWVQAAMNVNDLKLFEGNDSAIQHIAMAYNMPMPLIGLKDSSSTYNNLETAGKAVYTSAVIPMVNNICQNLTNYFQLKGVSLVAYFDHLDIFQKAKKDEADALASMTGALDVSLRNTTITKTEYRKLLANFMPHGSPFDAVKVDGSDYYIDIKDVTK